MFDLLDKPEGSVCDEEGEGQEDDAGHDHHPGKHPEGQLASHEDPIKIPDEEGALQSEYEDSLPHVWCERIGGGKGATPANGCNLGDVKSNCGSDAAHG